MVLFVKKKLHGIPVKTFFMSMTYFAIAISILSFLYVHFSTDLNEHFVNKCILY